MKICSKCGKECKDNCMFCASCGTSLADIEPITDTAEVKDTISLDKDETVRPEPTIPPYIASIPASAIPPYPMSNMQNMGFAPMNKQSKWNAYKLPDICGILGFVSALVGLILSGIVLEPIALISSLFSIIKGKYHRGLAIAAFIIAVVSFIVFLLKTLYENNILGRWAVDGILF